MKKTSLWLILAILFLVSCGEEERKLLEREDLFSLSLGVMSDELDYIYRERALLPGTSDLFMDEGIFYLSSRNMGKVMGMNSYGDLLTLLYNEDTNPEPREIVLSDLGEGANKIFRSWSFLEPGQLGISRDFLLVEDRVTGESIYYDEELEAYCDRVLLRFNEKGEYLDFIGREGVGGKPFPFIEDVSFRQNGEFVVVSRLDEGWRVYWYNSKGELMYRVFLEQALYPQFQEGYQSYMTQVMADPIRYRLFVMMSYYPSLEESDEDKTPQKRIYQLDIGTREYNSGASVPDEILRSGGEEQRFVYEMMGITEGGNILLLSPVDYNRFMLVGMDDGGKIHFRREILISEEPTMFTDFYFSPQGILSAIVYLENEARISWWRTDRIFRN